MTSPRCSSLARLVGPGLRADPDPGQTLVARNHLPPRLGREKHVVPRPELDLLAVDDDLSAPLDDHIDLLLSIRGMVVLRALGARAELELIDAEGGCPELLAHRLENPVLGLRLVGVPDCMCHYSSFSVDSNLLFVDHHPSQSP